MQIPDRSKSYKYTAAYRKDGGNEGSCQTDSRTEVDKFISKARKDPATQVVYLNTKVVYRRK